MEAPLSGDAPIALDQVLAFLQQHFPSAAKVVLNELKDAELGAEEGPGRADEDAIPDRASGSNGEDADVHRAQSVEPDSMR